DDEADRRCPLPEPQEGAARRRVEELLRRQEPAGPEEEAEPLRAARLAQAPRRRGHSARGAAEQGRQGRGAAARRRAAQGRAGRVADREDSHPAAPQPLEAWICLLRTPISRLRCSPYACTAALLAA